MSDKKIRSTLEVNWEDVIKNSILQSKTKNERIRLLKVLCKYLWGDRQWSIRHFNSCVYLVGLGWITDRARRIHIDNFIEKGSPDALQCRQEQQVHICRTITFKDLIPLGQHQKKNQILADRELAQKLAQEEQDHKFAQELANQQRQQHKNDLMMARKLAQEEHRRHQEQPRSQTTSTHEHPCCQDESNLRGRPWGVCKWCERTRSGISRCKICDTVTCFQKGCPSSGI